jgi:hypothetical protein
VPPLLVNMARESLFDTLLRTSPPRLWAMKIRGLGTILSVSWFS